MPIADEDFCDNYRADEDEIARRLAAGDEDFYVVYKGWINDGEIPSERAMCLAFDEVRSAIEVELLAGETEPHGGIRGDDCGAFRNFLLNYDCPARPYSDAELEAWGVDTSRPFMRDLVSFKNALRKYVVGDMLDDTEFELLNGAIFVRVQLRSISDTTTTKKIYAIPGRVVYRWSFDPTAGLWAQVDSLIEEAFEKSDSKLINVSGAVQLRLGQDATWLFQPIVIGQGMTTRGSRG